MLKPGARLGRFEVIGPIGAGGMGEVWRARDRRLDREVAIKVLPSDVAGDPDRLVRFEREARALARLSHPNILAVHELGEEGSITFVVTELLEGETLRGRLEAGALPWHEAVRIGAAVADGLAASHAQGIVHRDVKPDNVFLTADGQVKLLDFGLARVSHPGPAAEELHEAPTAAPPTEQGVTLGTVGYMAPEQVRGQAADARADIFALGCVLYEMLAGSRAFAGATSADTLSRILTSAPASFAEMGVELPPALGAIVEHCLEKNPERRFQSSRDLAFALRSLPAIASPAPAGAGRDGGRCVEGRPSIAVLPFANLSADPEQEYFCDGMAEEIINALAHLDGLRVIARTSSFAFKGASRDIRRIGAELDVEHVLEGSVRRAGDRLRITAQLIDVHDGSHLWSERFDRRLEDVFAIQDEIALAIVDNLKVRLLAGQASAVARNQKVSLEAYSAYLKGLYYWNRLSPEGYARSRECYEEAIRLDPGFADAHAQLGVWYGSQALWGALPPHDAHRESTALWDRALALDPRSAAAHASLGVGQAFIMRDWTAGERSMRLAVELAPNDPNALTNLACLLLVKGAWSDSVDVSRRAQRLDPLSPTLMTWTAIWMAYMGEVEEGRTELERQRAMHPDHWLPHHFLGDVLARQGLLADARREVEEAVEKSSEAPISLGLLARVCFRAGDRQAGDGLVARLSERAESTYVPPMFIAWAHLAQGDRDAALARVRQALAGHDPWLAFHRFEVPALALPDRRVDALIEPELP